MWRWLLAPKLGLVVLVAAGAGLVARLRAGPAAEAPPADQPPLEAAAAHFREVLSHRHGQAVGGLHVVPGSTAPIGLGQPVEVWYDAPAGAGLPRDLYVFSARISERGVPLVLDRAQPVVPTAAGEETLLAAVSGQALVAIGDPPDVLSLRRRAGGRLDLQLDQPTPVASARIAVDGFTVQLAGRAVEVVAGQPPPLGALVAVPAEGGQPPDGEPTIDAPLPPPVLDPPLGLPPQDLPGRPPWREVVPGIWRSQVGEVHVFVLDSRRLQLSLSAGLHSGTATGVGGRGVAPREAEAEAWFDGPPLAIAEEGRLITPPARLVPTVLLEGGRALLGPWDREGDAVGDAAQAPAALVLDGEVMPRRVHRPGDALRTARSGLGATEAGALVFVWSPAATATALGDVLRGLGVRYALPLGVGPTARGLWLPDAPPVVEGMASGVATPRLDNTFLLLPRQGFAPLPPWKSQGGPPVRFATRTGPGTVRWVLLDATATRLRLVPGPGEPWSGEDAPPEVGGDPAALVRLTAGVRGLRAPFGLAVGDTRWRAPRPEAFTLALDDDGRPHLGRFGRTLDAQRAWTALVQGPALLEGGRRVVEPVVPDQLPAAAFGVRADGHSVFAVAPTGDTEALVAALEAEGVTDALRLADRGTLDGGRAVVEGADVWTGPPQPATPVATVLEVLPAEPPPSVEVVPAIR